MKSKREAGYPIVGVTANIDDNKVDTQTIYSSYVDAIYHTRSIPLVLPMPDITLQDSYSAFAERIISGLDGLLLTGGDDVDASLYGEENFTFNGSFTEERDLFEMELCRAADAQKKPILGICRGAQLLNVAMGGTLFQDITKQNPKKTLLMHAQKSPSYSGVHDALIEPGSHIERLLVPSGGKILVNSFHHQAVKDVAPGFIASAAASDGIIEAIEKEGGGSRGFAIGVQWHPERMRRRHKHAERIFAAFAEACGS
ncbi:MAG: gamma-glutamyl-gamma-aminobutyrate hydrolase family protein [Synergistaceae bacterium]|nr:gamma-glutamyl-gamma-aminobutyrate hydrolase family protein [Synergistaceae bacterium]